MKIFGLVCWSLYVVSRAKLHRRPLAPQSNHDTDVPWFKISNLRLAA